MPLPHDALLAAEPHPGRQSMPTSKAKLALSSVKNHFYVSVSSSSLKIDKLMRCIHAMDVKRSLAFVSSQRIAMHVRERLVANNIQV